MKKITICVVLLFFIACKNAPEENTSKSKQPNILWIVTEDISPTLSFYSDNTAKTPNLDKLAKEAIVYKNAFAVVGVCGPSRSSIITGMYATSLGTMHMRTGKDVFSWGKRVYQKDISRQDIANKNIIQYAAVVPEEVKCFTEYLRAAGYYTTNNEKTDYQFAAPITSWDENNRKAHWRNRPKNKPFFSVFNFGLTHESRLWKHKDSLQTVNPNKVPVPPYLPDNKDSRESIARHYSNLELMDAQVGEVIKQLKEDGLYDETIIFFYSDHGGPLPRQKREILDSGLKVPLLVKGIKEKKGENNSLISFVDLAPTILSLAGIEPPKYMEGKAFLGKYKVAKRSYVYGSSDRFDEFTDRIRSVRDDRFLYLKNYHPELPKYKDVAYRKNIPMMATFLNLRDEKKLNDDQQIWFQTKTSEELYDCLNDPFNLVNLAADKAHQSILLKMRKALVDFQTGRKDYGAMPESEMIAAMWPNFEQPKTKEVVFNRRNQKIELTTFTKGASIGYIISDKPLKDLDFNSGWSLYSAPLSIKKGKYLYAIAERIGFKESEISSHQIE
ncbi:sulfatase-like hydrolase/transferase [Polaribacter sp. R77954]|uniref:sulfatase-like hydrolase/transferase n=1 Tax=Polaribacter sp. R77954 TaxID=3093870 RepID=UPI0037C82691